MSNILVLPIVLPMLIGSILIFFAKRHTVQRVISGITVFGMMGLSIYLAMLVYDQPNQMLVLEMGNWPAPFGIVLTADLFSVLMVMLSSLIGLVCLFFAFKTIDQRREKVYFYPFYFYLLTGVHGAFLTGDLFNLFVFFEVMLISSYVLIVLGGTKYQLRESFKYVVINIFASSLFLIAIAVLYASVGTVNMADLAQRIAEAEQQGVLNAIAVLFFIVFALKGALFPLYFWLPKSYYGPPAAVAALFGALLTKVGIYAIIRMFTLVFTHNQAFTHELILVIAGLTMFFGVLGAVSQFDFKRILAYHIISQVGYMVMGLGIFTPLALAGAIYYIAHHIIVKAALFLFAGATQKVTGTTDLHKMGGLLRFYPWLGWLFLIAAISLAGIPPFSGFFSKFALIVAGLEESRYIIVGVALLVGLLTLVSMLKIFIYVFWGEPKMSADEARKQKTGGLLAPIVPLVVLTVVLGIAAEPVFEFSLNIANQLLDPSIYVETILGSGHK